VDALGDPELIEAVLPAAMQLAAEFKTRPVRQAELRQVLAKVLFTTKDAYGVYLDGLITLDEYTNLVAAHVVDYAVCTEKRTERVQIGSAAAMAELRLVLSR